MVTDVLHDVFQSQPGLGGGGDDLVGWQDETIATCVSQLEGIGVLDAQIVRPVDAAATGSIWEEEEELWTRLQWKRSVSSSTKQTNNKF